MSHFYFKVFQYFLEIVIYSLLSF